MPSNPIPDKGIANNRDRRDFYTASALVALITETARTVRGRGIDRWRKTAPFVVIALGIILVFAAAAWAIANTETASIRLVPSIIAGKP